MLDQPSPPYPGLAAGHSRHNRKRRAAIRDGQRDVGGWFRDLVGRVLFDYLDCAKLASRLDQSHFTFAGFRSGRFLNFNRG